MAEPEHYPFTAIVGQEKMCLALLLNAVNPAIGGALIRGEKGTAKSTAVRALAAILPPIETIDGCPYPIAPAEAPNELWPHAAAETVMRPAPLVDLPLGATEDRVVGTLDLEQALQHGQRRFEPGLLAKAHRGILYIDEVNLLVDHLVDVLLDAAAMGVNRVAREGVAVTHPARFILVGTMNPEEGELRPQLLDRFGLAVDVAGSQVVPERTKIVHRRLAFEANPAAFAAQFAADEAILKERIVAARTSLPQVVLDEALLALISQICVAFAVDGMRADLVIHKTARTVAAWHGRMQVTEADIQRAAELALLHRRRRQPFEQPGMDAEKLDKVMQQHQQQKSPPSAPDDVSEGDDAEDD